MTSPNATAGAVPAGGTLRASAAPEHPNARLLRDFFVAFGAADRNRLAQLLTADFVWHFPGTSAIAGDWRGVDGLLGGIRGIAMTLGDGHNGFELLDVLATDHSAVTLHRDYYRGPGNHFDLRFVIYVRVEGGKMAEAWELPFDPHESDRYHNRQAGALAQRTLAAREAEAPAGTA